MSIPRPDRSTSSRKRERGAALVELSLVASVLVVFILGIFEIGMVWSDHQSLTQASRSGARVGSQLGLKGEADRAALQAIEAAIGTLDGTLTRVVIFEADTSGEMPPARETATVGYSGPANCNVYDATSIASLGNPALWGSGTSCGTADDNWCSATDRDGDLYTASFVGVQVEFEREYLTGFFGGGTQLITEQTVMRIEPGANT